MKNAIKEQVIKLHDLSQELQRLVGYEKNFDHKKIERLTRDIRFLAINIGDASHELSRPKRRTSAKDENSYLLHQRTPNRSLYSKPRELK